MLAAPGTARAGVLWRGGPPGCEPLATFYSSTHQPGTPPCCPTQPTVCPGGTVCPGNGRCPGTGTPCVASNAPSRPNVILTISDDQGSCHYGTAGECRSVQSGTPIPPPATPNLDLLAGYGTVFPIAHNTASWCFPSLNSMLTGRYQKSFDGMRRDLSGNFRTIPAVLRDLEGLPGTVRDPFDADNVIGGYCTLLAGKFTGAAGKTEFNGQARTGERALGRELCSSGSPGQPPPCGTQGQVSYNPLTTLHMKDLFEFMDSLFYPVPNAPGAFTHAPFFIWYAPRIPHAPLRAPAQIENYLFGTGLGGMLQLGGMCRGASCAPAVRSFSESNFGNERDYYANVWWVDDTLREIPEVSQPQEQAALHPSQRSESLHGDGAVTVQRDLGDQPDARARSQHRHHLPLRQRVVPARLEAQLLREWLPHALARLRPAHRERGSRLVADRSAAAAI